jgi:hypothetical protein
MILSKYTLWGVAAGCHSFWNSLEEGFESVKGDSITEKAVVQCDVLYLVHFLKITFYMLFIACDTLEVLIRNSL